MLGIPRGRAPYCSQVLAAERQASLTKYILLQSRPARRSILEPESLVAIAIYSLIGWGIVSLIRMMTRARGAEAA